MAEHSDEQRLRRKAKKLSLSVCKLTKRNCYTIFDADEQELTPNTLTFEQAEKFLDARAGLPTALT